MARGMQSIQDIDRTYYRLVWRCWEKCWPVQKQHVFHQAMGRAQLRYKIESHLCWAQNLPWTTCQIQCVSFQNSHLQRAPHILILHQCHYFVWNRLPVKGNKSLTMWHSRVRRSILSSIETIKTELVLRYWIRVSSSEYRPSSIKISKSNLEWDIVTYYAVLSEQTVSAVPFSSCESYMRRYYLKHKIWYCAKECAFLVPEGISRCAQAILPCA